MISLQEKSIKVVDIYFILLIVESSVLIYFSLQPPVFVFPKMLRYGDIEHLIAYIFYGFLLCKVLGVREKNLRVFAVSVFIGFLFGCFTEAIQYLVPFRETDIIDCFVDGVGVIIGSIPGFKT